MLDACRAFHGPVDLTGPGRPYLNVVMGGAEFYENAIGRARPDLDC